MTNFIDGMVTNLVRIYAPPKLVTAFLLRLLVTLIFMASAVGKAVGPTEVALSLVQLFDLAPRVAFVAVYVLSALEAAFAVAIWYRARSTYLLVPVLLWLVFLVSVLRGVACGCFGSLPFLSQVSTTGHFLLLAGVFVALYHLMEIQENSVTLEQTGEAAPGGPGWRGMAAIVLLLAAFLPLPFPGLGSPGGAAPADQTVDRAYVEAALSLQSRVIVDARSRFAYELGHIDGAINIPYDSPDKAGLVAANGLRDKAVIVYCSSVQCNQAELLADELRSLGCGKVKVYAGGWAEWRRVAGK